MSQQENRRGDSGWRSGGAVPGMPGEPAYHQRVHRLAPIPVLIAVPHAGRCYSPELQARMRIGQDAALRLEDRLVDHVAREVALETGASLIIAHAPRALIDLNRATDDVDWQMIDASVPSVSVRHAAGRRARSGLGLVPRRLSGVGEIWRGRISSAELDERIELVHRPYHRALGRMFEGLRDRWGRALLVDLHSMPPLAPPAGQGEVARFVLGDRFGATCDSALVTSALDHFAVQGQVAAHNRPYAGGYVLDRHGAPARGMNALQLEICRAAYLDGRLREPGEGLREVVCLIVGLVRRLASEMIASPESLAAE